MRNADSIQAGEWVISRARWGDSELFTVRQSQIPLRFFDKANQAKDHARRLRHE